MVACGSEGYSLCVSEHSSDANADPANIIIIIIHTYTHTHTSDLPIAEAMIANSYVRHSNLCWDYTIQQLARLMN